MNVSFYIARRYLKAKRKKNAINLITRIAVFGITAITAALIILLSAFNGIETMVEKLYSDFDSDLVLRSSTAKTFNEAELDLKKILRVSGINAVSRAVEETVIVKHEQRWTNARIIGVEPEFLKMSNMQQHMVDGYATMHENGKELGIIGAGLLDKLQGFIPQQSSAYESIIVYGPKRNIKMRLGSNPFTTQQVLLAGRMNFNREVNEEALVLPLSKAREILQFEDEINAVYIDVSEDYDNFEVKEELQAQMGEHFEVKTSYEKNELIFQTSKTEKLIVLAILVFIFILASFNLVASLTMLYVEKRNDMSTLRSFGASTRNIFNIFFLEGLLISAKGIIIGVIIGYAVCFAQLKFSLLQMPNSFGEAFPIKITLVDGALIILLVCGLCLLSSYFTVKMLMRKNQV